jgi:hypothetical protein
MPESSFYKFKYCDIDCKCRPFSCSVQFWQQLKTSYSYKSINPHPPKMYSFETVLNIRLNYYSIYFCLCSILSCGEHPATNGKCDFVFSYQCGCSCKSSTASTAFRSFLTPSIPTMPSISRGSDLLLFSFPVFENLNQHPKLSESRNSTSASQHPQNHKSCPQFLETGSNTRCLLAGISPLPSTLHLPR